MQGRDILVIGTSAGGVEALRALVGGLPGDFPGSVFVVMHTAPDSPGVLSRLAGTTVAAQGGYEVSEELTVGVRIAMEDSGLELGITRLGQPSAFTCPECHGSLLQLKENGRSRYRCHTGHAYSADSLLSELTESVEATLWAAIRSINESAMLMRHMAEHARESGDGAAGRFLEKARDAERRGDLVRQAVFDHENLGEEQVAAVGDAGR